MPATLAADLDLRLREISEVVRMTDVLIRNVPEAELRRVDQKAERLGLTRPEYLRRQISQDAARTLADEPPTVDAFRRLSALTSDLLDEDVFRDAWA